MKSLSPARRDAPSSRSPSATRLALRSVAIGYLAALLVVPVGMVFYRAFEKGFGTAWDAVTTPPAQHAFYLTCVIAAIAVPANAVFGVATAWLLARYEFRGKRLLDALIDLPFAVSPVVVGLALILVWGREGWFASTSVIFSTPGMVLATIFVSLPFVVREVEPVLREEGIEQEQAAQTLGANGFQILRRITLPTIRWGLTYGVILATARALGEFGAVAIVSGKISGRTETLTLYVEDRFQSLDLAGAYAAALVLALIAVVVLALMTLLQRRHKEA
jgi:sulfate/thiosulfate transport system permease protein